MELPATYEEALALHDGCLDILSRDPSVDSEEDEYLRTLVPSGIYEHFKSTPQNTKYYGVDGEVRGVDTDEYEVKYMALYPPRAGKGATRELVGEDGFLMPVDRELEDGSRYRGARFRLVQPAPLETLYLIAKGYMT